MYKQCTSLCLVSSRFCIMSLQPQDKNGRFFFFFPPKVSKIISRQNCIYYHSSEEALDAWEDAGGNYDVTWQVGSFSGPRKPCCALSVWDRPCSKLSCRDKLPQLHIKKKYLARSRRNGEAQM